MQIRRTAAAVSAVTVLSFSGIALASPANAQVKQDGLVNVAVGDITIEDAVDVNVAASIAATLCDLVDVAGVAVLANNTDTTSRTSTVCRTESGKVRFTQNN